MQAIAEVKMNGNKKALSIDKALDHVPETGFEPAHPFGRHHLKVVRLPISPPGQTIWNLGFNVRVKQHRNAKFPTPTVRGLQM